MASSHGVRAARARASSGPQKNEQLPGRLDLKNRLTDELGRAKDLAAAASVMDPAQFVALGAFVFWVWP
jgi:hypothetical protein